MSQRVLPLPSQEELLRVFEYDADLGLLVWRERWDGRVTLVGTVAGSVMMASGYRRVRYKNREYYQHRIIFKMLNGYDPEEVDHRNVDNAHNDPSNLRNATSSQNKSNRRGFAKSGFKGVQQRGNKFYAFLTYLGSQVYLGSYNTPEEAHEQYAIMAELTFGAYANTEHRNAV